jgi:release factor glutamine methyltransferase
VGRSVLQAEVLIHPDRPLDPAALARYEALVARRAGGEPLPYVLGRWAFYRYEFEVTPDVLLPRPETEHLVEAGLAWACEQAQEGAGLSVADVGTGSGVIAVSLALALPGAAVYGLDVSPAALAVAGRNAARLGAANLRLAQGDLLDALPPAIVPDLVAANLPYIPSAELEDLAVARSEPRLALDGGPDGLALIRRLVAQCVARAARRFCLLLEIAAGQGDAASQICRAHFPEARVDVINDYAGHDRVVRVVR